MIGRADGDPPAVGSCETVRCQGFRHGADLIDLQQQCIGGTRLNGPPNAAGIRAQQIVAHHQHPAAKAPRQLRPVRQIIFRQSVLDAHDGIVRRPALKLFNHARAAQFCFSEMI